MLIPTKNNISFNYEKRNINILIHGEIESFASPIAIKFIPNTKFLIIGDEDGFLHFYDVKDNSITKRLKCHDNSIFDIKVNGTYFLTASGDKCIKKWDFHKLEKDAFSAYEGHYGSVKCIDICPTDKNYFASASRDGSIKLWDNRFFKSTDQIYNAHILDTCGFNSPASKVKKMIVKNIKSPRNIDKTNVIVQKFRYSSYTETVDLSLYKNYSVTGISYQSETQLISCGASNNQIKIWDLRKTHHAYTHGAIPIAIMSPNTSTEAKYGYTQIQLNSTKTLLYANAAYGNILCFDMTVSPDEKRHTHSFYKNVHESTNSKPQTPNQPNKHCSVYYDRIDLSPCNLFLLSGSATGNCFLWNTQNPNSLSRQIVENHETEISCVAWKDLTQFVTSDAKGIEVWDIKFANQDTLSTISPNKPQNLTKPTDTNGTNNSDFYNRYERKSSNKNKEFIITQPIIEFDSQSPNISITQKNQNLHTPTCNLPFYRDILMSKTLLYAPNDKRLTKQSKLSAIPSYFSALSKNASKHTETNTVKVKLKNYIIPISYLTNENDKTPKNGKSFPLNYVSNYYQKTKSSPSTPKIKTNMPSSKRKLINAKSPSANKSNKNNLILHYLSSTNNIHTQ